MDAYRQLLEDRLILAKGKALSNRTAEHLTEYGQAIMDCRDEDRLARAAVLRACEDLPALGARPA